MLFDDILVVADRDDNRQLALRAALDLTRGMKARLSVVAFVHDPIVDEATLVSRTEARRMQAKMIADKRDWLAGIVARHKVEGVAVRQQVAWAKDIAAWVIDEVAGKGHRLIVKSGHRSESLVHTPTDWSLLRQAPVPVMIVRDRLRRRPGRVVAAIDLLSRDPKQQTLDRRVLGHAAGVARQIGAELHVVAAVPLSTLAHDLDLIDRALLERRSREKAADAVAALCEEFALPADRFTLKAGPPERVIDGVASKLKATLLVMGTAGRKGLRARLLGNTAEKVLHRNRSTVLVVRPV